MTAAVYLNQGKLREGREALLRAREIRRGDIASNETLARLALAAGRPDEARRYFQDILEAHPESAGTYIALAELEAKTGREAAAEAVLLKGVPAAAAGPEIAVALARLQLSIGEAEKALAGATEALEKFPRNPALLEIVGTAQLALGQTGEALSTFKNLIDVAPDLAAGHTGLAKAYLAQFTPDNPQWPAVNEAMQAVNLAPQDTEAKLLLARALALHGRFARRATSCRNCGASNPRMPNCSKSRRLSRAGKAVPPRPRQPPLAPKPSGRAAARRRLAELQLRRGDTDQAVKSLTDWLDTHPEDNETRKVLAEICVNAGRLAEAHAHYLQLAAQEPKNPIFQNNLAWVLARLERWQEALPYASSAAALEPGSVEFLDTLGAVLLQTGKPAEALEYAGDRLGTRPRIGLMSVITSRRRLRLRAGRRRRCRCCVRFSSDGDTIFGERDQAQLLLQQLGG